MYQNHRTRVGCVRLFSAPFLKIKYYLQPYMFSCSRAAQMHGYCVCLFSERISKSNNTVRHVFIFIGEQEGHFIFWQRLALTYKMSYRWILLFSSTSHHLVLKRPDMQSAHDRTFILSLKTDSKLSMVPSTFPAVSETNQSYWWNYGLPDCDITQLIQQKNTETYHVRGVWSVTSASALEHDGILRDVRSSVLAINWEMRI